MMEYTPVLTTLKINKMLGEIEQALNQQMREGLAVALNS